MSNNVFFINWAAFQDNSVLMAIREKPIVKAFISCALSPFTIKHQTFLAYRADAIYRARHNSQICYLTAMLNDKFDPVLRRIRIKNTAFKQPVYFYEIEDNQPVPFYEIEDNDPVTFPEPSELGGNGLDYTVYVPPALQPGTSTAELVYKTRMRGQIDIYSLYSKNYDIVWQDMS